MLKALLIILAFVCAIQAVRSGRLITSSLWLASVSALLSIVFYLMGAHTVAVIELSVGAGLVTVLFVFAINIAGEETILLPPLVPWPMALGLVIIAILLLGWLILPLPAGERPVAESSFAAVLWGQRGLDVLVQIVLIFAGVLGLLGLLAETNAPLDQPVAKAVMAQRDYELENLQQQVADREKEMA